MVEILEQLIVLSIGVSNYQYEEFEAKLPSAIFDSILIGNKFEQRGFNKKVLENPSLSEIMQSLEDLKSNCEDMHSFFNKSNTSKTTYVIVYFAGYADNENNIILSNGDKINLQKELVNFFFELKNSHLLIFQDCMTLQSDYGEILCKSNAVKPTYVYSALFRSNDKQKYLKNKNCAIITQKLLLANIAGILLSRT